MKFRTEIETFKASPIAADARILLLGSCFADNIGERLSTDGFDVTHNPLGPLFNPHTVADALERALDRRPFTKDELVFRDGVFHALDGAARYASPDADILISALNRDFNRLSEAACKADLVFVTFGTAYVYRHNESGKIVANCHRLHPNEFVRERLSPDEISHRWKSIAERLLPENKRLIITVSPVRHTADGLHGNNISKSILLLAADMLGCEYFPSYEIICDDLRDYRYYTDDLKHPSTAAIEYIYEKFADTYFSPATKEIARERHAQYLRSAHRPQKTIL